MSTNKSYGSIPLKTIKHALEQAEKNARVYNMTAEQVEEMPITFEYLIGSFFPEVLKNIEKEVNIQYTKGYFAGRKAMEEELNGTTGNDA